MLKTLLVSVLVLAASTSAYADDKCDEKIHKQIVLKASFAYDRGCIFHALVVRGKSYADVGAATPKAMAVLGWKKAKDPRRGELAMAWIQDVLTRVGEYRIVWSTDDDSSADFKAKFYEPKTETRDGAVTIRYWRDETVIGMRQPDTRDLVETQVTIDAKGALTVTDLSSVAEPFR